MRCIPRDRPQLNPPSRQVDVGDESAPMVAAAMQTDVARRGRALATGADSSQEALAPRPKKAKTASAAKTPPTPTAASVLKKAEKDISAVCTKVSRMASGMQGLRPETRTPTDVALQKELQEQPDSCMKTLRAVTEAKILQVSMEEAEKLAAAAADHALTTSPAIQQAQARTKMKK